MALQRKPVEDPQEPGYPSSNEYVTGRRAFLGLLGLTALGFGGVYLLKGSGESAGNGRTGGVPRVPSTPQGQIGGAVAVPQAPPMGVVEIARPPQPVTKDAPTPDTVVQPQADIKGEIAIPELPKAKPIAPPPGAPPRPKDDPQKPAAPNTAGKPAQPVLPASDVTAPVPVRPQAAIRGEPGPPPAP